MTPTTSDAYIFYLCILHALLSQFVLQDILNIHRPVTHIVSQDNIANTTELYELLKFTFSAHKKAYV